jgi:aryl-alcohol dehydrogenase-like predicted oxidoreductase/enamine deaminase RidA (YjgF/YER057c/UK114 family)
MTTRMGEPRSQKREETATPDRIELAPGLEISRVVTGLWQVADMERGGGKLDPDRAAAAMAEYAAVGFDSFDMADHYGSAEEIAGSFNRLVAAGDVKTPSGRRSAAFTKWCPAPGPMDPDIVRAGVARSAERMQVGTIDLLQFHWWSFHHLAYLDALRELAALRQAGLIGALGVTNFDTDHLHLAVQHGFPIASNQVSFSLLDRRAAEDMTAFCLARGVKLLAYGTLAGGLLSERWLGRSEPDPAEIADWSKSKYKRFIDTIGGWAVLQTILAALEGIARKHGVSIANVATRWVLEQPAVAAVIIGARLGEREHRADNLQLFAFALDAEDHRRIDAALAQAKRIPGDCGDEYRRPPFLTASGDLSHHLDSLPKYFRAEPMPERPDRLRIDSGSLWEPLCGYSRAVRAGDRILVSGTTATHGNGEAVCPGDPRGQAVYILDKIAASIAALGGTLEDVVRTRIYMADATQWEPVARAHGRVLGHVRPANTLVEARLVGDYLVEIEAEAVLGA